MLPPPFGEKLAKKLLIVYFYIQISVYIHTKLCETLYLLPTTLGVGGFVPKILALLSKKSTQWS